MNQLGTAYRAGRRCGTVPRILAPLGMALIAAACRASEPLEIHVAPGGCDDHPGTADRPVASLRAAQGRVRELLEETRARSLRVLIHDGIYRIEAPLLFTPADAPEAGHTVTWTAAPGARPGISGGRPVTDWRRRPDGVLVAPAGEMAGDGTPRELFVNGERRPRARHPSRGPARIEAPGRDRRTYFRFRPGDLPAALDGELVGTGLELVFFHDWSVTRVPVRSVDSRAGVLHAAHRVGAEHDFWHMSHWEPQPRYWIENHPALLDTPGEWVLDPAAGLLAYLPREGECPESLEAVTPRSEGLLIVRGDEDRPVRGLVFRGLVFEHSKWALPPEGYAGVQATGHQNPREGPPPMNRRFIPAAILFERAEDCVFEGNTVRHMGASAVWFGSRTARNRIAANLIDDISGNGIMIGEDSERIADGDRWAVTVPGQAAAGNLVEDNVIQRCGMQFFGAVGVWVGMAADTVVRHNLIRHLPYSGISTGWRWNPRPSPCRGTRIEANHIHDVMLALGDGGGVYTLGYQPGAVITRNVIRRVPPAAGRAQSNGLFFDNSSSGILASENLVFDIGDAPVRFNISEETRGLEVSGNLLAPAPGAAAFEFGQTRRENVVLADNRVVPRGAPDPGMLDEWLSRTGPRGKIEAPDPAGAFDSSPPPPPLAIGEDFERWPAGVEPPPLAEVRTEGRGDAIEVTGRVAAAGRQSLMIRDAPGLEHSWNPHFFYPMNHREGRTRAVFFLRIGSGALVTHEWRSRGPGGTRVGPRLETEDNRLLAGGRELLRLPPDEWVRMEILAGVGRDADGFWTLTVTLPDGTPRTFSGLRNADPDFSDLTWIGWISPALDTQVFYVDEISVTPETED